MTFFDRLKEARINAGLTQEQLAQKLGIGKSTLSGYENGNREPAIATITKILKILGIDANYLYQDELDNINSSPMKLLYSDIEHLKKYRSIDSHGRELIDTIMDRELKRINTTAKDVHRLIHYYPTLSLADSGEFIFDRLPIETIEIPDTFEYKNVRFAVGINERSMEPEYYEGDKLLIEPANFIEPGEIGLFVLQGKTLVRKCGTDNLISINENYENIPLTSDIRCIGRVVDKISVLDSLSEKDLDTIAHGLVLEKSFSYAQNRKNLG